MDLLSTVRKSGSRGGVNFSWDDVAQSAHRENYLGHSLKAPVGRWAKGRDLNWYAKADPTAADSGETEAEREARERREEIRKIKEAEEDAINRALGLPITPRNVTGANAVEVDGSKVPKREDSDLKKEDNTAVPRESRPSKDSRREGRHRDSDRHSHRRRHRSRDRDRSRSRNRDRSRERRRDGMAEGKDRDRHDRLRSRSPERRSRHHHGRRRDEERSRSRSRDYDRRDHHRRRSRSRSRGHGPKTQDRRRDRSRDRYDDKDHRA